MRPRWLALLAFAAAGCGDVEAKWILHRAGATTNGASVDMLRAFQRFARDVPLGLVSLSSLPRELFEKGPVDLGLGIRVFRLRKEEIGCKADVAVFGDDAVVEHTVHCDRTGRERLDAAVLPYLPNRSFDWSHRNETTFQLAALGRAATLGAQTAAAVPEPLRESYDRLTALSSEGVFGDHCGAGGEKPEQRVAMETLVAADRWDLVRNVLRGPNATGRAYAANALWVHGPLDPADRGTVDTLAVQPGGVRTCGGCSYSGSANWRLFRETYLTMPSHR